MKPDFAIIVSSLNMKENFDNEQKILQEILKNQENIEIEPMIGINSWIIRGTELQIIEIANMEFFKDNKSFLLFENNQMYYAEH